MKNKLSLEERFWSKVDKSAGPDACWPWAASRRLKGYGQFNAGGRNASANRFAYELTHGALPKGEGYVCHTCDNPACCNPAHLFLGTPAVNSRDMVSKGRARRGEAHYRAKLSDSDLVAIRCLRLVGAHTQRELSSVFGVSQSQIHAVLSGARC